MYAVIQSGGKQYRVQPGTVVQVEKLELEVGKSITFDQVLFLSAAKAEAAQVWLGKPFVAGAKVQGEVVGQGRGEKILIIKMKRRKQYRRTQGHRQCYTQILVTSVDNGAGNTANLTAEDKKAKLGQFQSHLKPKGLAMTPPTIGSRKRNAQKASAAAGKTEARAAGSPSSKTAKATSATKKTTKAK